MTKLPLYLVLAVVGLGGCSDSEPSVAYRDGHMVEVKLVVGWCLLYADGVEVDSWKAPEEGCRLYPEFVARYMP